MDHSISTGACNEIRAADRIVIKVGSAILCGEDGVKTAWLKSLADDIAELCKRGCGVTVVSSGAIAIGAKILGLSSNLQLDEKQAASAIGQTALIQAWQKAFAAHNIQSAQILLTLDDTEQRRRYLNARNALLSLLEFGVIPVINENDAVATAEIRYGDNDRLAAHAAQIVGAEALVILSDIDGLYTDDPRTNENAKHIPIVDNISPEIEAMALGPNSQAGVGSGGMASKLAAAKIAVRNGCAAIIASGKEENPLTAILNGAQATLFKPAQTIEGARKQWIAGRLSPRGTLVVDTGAVQAIKKGASLLPAGIVSVAGAFQRGDLIDVKDSDGRDVAYGLSTYDQSDLEKVAGLQSAEIEQVLGYKRRPAAVEKNDLILKEG